MASVKNMNAEIALFLNGNSESQPQNFHEDYNLLMIAMDKAIGVGQELSPDDFHEKILFFSIYPNKEILNKREGNLKLIYKIKSYSCVFTKFGVNRISFGAKLNHEFEQSSIIRAMHYSLYRLIKNGLEY